MMVSSFTKEVVDFLNLLSIKHGIGLVPDYVDQEVSSVFIPSISVKIVFHEIEPIHKDLDQTGSNCVDIKHVHLWEDQWIYHKDKIASKIQSLFGITKRIHGRETKVKTIDNVLLLNFLEKNHLNVAIKAKYKYGLYFKNELVAVMSFSKGRPLYRNDVLFNSFEMLRFCSKLGTTVVGGFSKLLNHFIKKIEPDDVMTYVDADWSDGQSFLKHGFEFKEHTPPMEFWLNVCTGIREYPHIILEKYGELIDLINLEAQKDMFLQKNGYKKVFNSGSYKFILPLK